MPVRVHARQRVLVIAASGELDLVSVPLLDAAVDAALGGSWAVIVVDLADLQFIDVVGARPLLRLARQLPPERRLVIVNVSTRAEPALRWLGLGSFLVPVEELPLTCDQELTALLGH
jgi:anti-anti-sigma factor